MNRRFIVRPLAEADLLQAAQWYDEQQAGLGSRFVAQAYDWLSATWTLAVDSGSVHTP